MKQLSPFSTLLLFAVLTITGIAVLPMVNLQLNPSSRSNKMSVSWSWSGATPRIMEQLVTSKLEGGLSTIQGIKELNSTSGKGEGSIDIEFKEGLNPDIFRFEVASMIRRLYPELPEGVRFPEISTGENSNSSPLLTYNVIAPVSPFEIENYLNEFVTPRLGLLDGVNQVQVYGATPWGWTIEYKSEICQALQIMPAAIAKSINQHFAQYDIGLLSTKNKERIHLKMEKEQGEQIDWSKLVVERRDDRIIYLTDVATISYQEREPSQYFRVNGFNTVNLVIYPQEQVNSLDLTKQVKTSIESLGQKMPEKWAFRLTYDSSEYLEKELQTILMRTGLSFLFLLIFVLLVSRSFRYLLFVFVSLTVNLCIAFLFYWLGDIQIQLYSLAGVTISLGVIIDNSIVMIDHLRHKGSMRVFFAILAATVTTIGSLVVVFLLEESQRNNLVDFAWVIIINLSVSIMVALFFIPSLMKTIPLQRDGKVFKSKRKRQVIRFEHAYQKCLSFLFRFKTFFVVLLIWSFGIPLFLLPESIDKEKQDQNQLEQWYTSVSESDWFQSETFSTVKVWTGGAFRLFVDGVYNSSYYSEPERTKLYVRAKMPEGATLRQMNDAVKQMENYMTNYEEIDLFLTNIYSPQYASIEVLFTEQYENGVFPYILKQKLIRKAVSTGGMDWSITGVGRGFSNSIHTGWKNGQIQLEGYNYALLLDIASRYRDELKEVRRVEDVGIEGEISWRSSPKTEYNLEIDPYYTASLGWNSTSILKALQFNTYEQNLTPIYQQDGYQAVSLQSDQQGNFETWQLMNAPLISDSLQNRFASFGSIEKKNTQINILKENQVYLLYLTFNFVGPEVLKKRIVEKLIKKINGELPIGFKAKPKLRNWGWNRENQTQYYLIFVVVFIIYLICAVLLESFLQPFAVILMIPISFIGVFLTFYLFELNFDQGGYASFIMLCGLSVNSALYILNDFNQFKNQRPNLRFVKKYMKAFQHKIMPILLTILSTVLGLIPFILNGQNEVFWYAFAVGTIGGLLFSLIAIFVYLPLFLWKRTHHINR